ncbi:NADPH oxidase 5 [Protopterus annectens]|uniref:NADPH oxidase 5 n=1 Tax=Protopterus annectens TaxID=7888 RepID=UPI001CFC0C35|nr:NADPH oxidase 5 [Protopterus annectens]
MLELWLSLVSKSSSAVSRLGIIANMDDDNVKWLEWVTKQFESIAGEDKKIDLEEFKAALKVKESFFAERFFAIFDSDGNGSISLDELLRALNLLIHGNETDKLQFLFKVYDVDGNCSIDSDELRTVLKSCLKESAISLPDEKLDDLTVALFESADKDKSGSITFKELKEELERFPEVMENLTISAANWLKPPGTEKKKRHTPRYLTLTYWQNNTSKLLFMFFYICVNILLFTLAAGQYQVFGGWIMVARGCGRCLNLNCTLIVVLMFRRCLTWLRATWVARVLPLDQHVLLHQLVGYAIFAFSTVHTFAHTANFVNMVKKNATFQLWEYFLTTRPRIGWIHGTASITGIVLQLLISLILICSSTCVRRSGHFEVFYWTHLCYILFWILLILHCTNFWKWFVVPGCIFLLEKIVGITMSHIGHLSITEVNLLPSKVTHLVIKRPHFFNYKPGDYIYLNIPIIAKYEWHPFTISSAPEYQEYIWFHIRSAGQWTNRLYEYFREREPISNEAKRLTRSLKIKHQKCRQEHCFEATDDDDDAVPTNADKTVELTSYKLNHVPFCETAKKHLQTNRAGSPQPRESSAKLNENHVYCNIKCYIDGPYGTPTRRIFTSEHAVLIGAGIGITPFASILQSIMYRYRMRKQTCPNSGYSWCENLKDNEMRLRKVDFLWINRDQKSFEWFVSLLTAMEMDQADGEPEGRFLEMQMYMTSALSRNDMKAIGLQMALDLLAKKEKRDSITGLKTRTQPGRPDWNKVFHKVADEKKGKVHVFFCGSPALAKVIKTHCEQFGFKFYKENF